MKITSLYVLLVSSVIFAFMVVGKLFYDSNKAEKEKQTESISVNKYMKVIIFNVDKEAKFDVKWITNQ